MMLGLKRCPCCGGSAEMREHICFGAVYVRCRKCHLSTCNIHYDNRGYPSLPSKEEAEQVAAARWNRRRKKNDRIGAGD